MGEEIRGEGLDRRALSGVMEKLLENQNILITGVSHKIDESNHKIDELNTTVNNFRIAQEGMHSRLEERVDQNTHDITQLKHTTALHSKRINIATGGLIILSVLVPIIAGIVGWMWGHLWEVLNNAVRGGIVR